MVDTDNKKNRTRKELQDSPLRQEEFGIPLEKVPKIKKRRSIWGIDDSGDPSFKPKTSDFHTQCAVTVLSNEAVNKITKGVPRYNGEMKFTEMMRRNPNECVCAMKQIGDQNILAVCNPQYKRGVPEMGAKEFFQKTNKEVVDTIKKVDKSNHVYVYIDSNTYMKEDDYKKYNNRRVKVSGQNSKRKPIIQMADTVTSSLGLALRAPDYGRDDLFRIIMPKCVNIAIRPDTKSKPKTNKRLGNRSRAGTSNGKKSEK